MKNTDIIFFDNTDDYSKYDEAEQAVYESFCESQDWTSINDVPADMVWDEISLQNEAEWKYFSDAFKRLLKKHTFLITGTCGRWNGPCEGGNFITDWDDFRSFIQHLDTLKIYEQNGHFYIEVYHHDGHDLYELKRLTDKGAEYADRHCFAHNRALHRSIMKAISFQPCRTLQILSTEKHMKPDLHNPYGYKVCYREHRSKTIVRYFIVHGYKKAVDMKQFYSRYPSARAGNEPTT